MSKAWKSATVMITALGVSTLTLSACDRDAPDPEPSPTPTASTNEKPVSILRPDVEQPVMEVVLEPLVKVIGFPEGGATLSDTAKAQLKAVLDSPQLEEGGPVVLRGHSDSDGTDATNMRASTSRAEAVKTWLIDNGLDEDRITVIAFGEQNPVEPNANPDGSPNEAGRKANRRVEVVVQVASDMADDDEPAAEMPEDAEVKSAT